MTGRPEDADLALRAGRLARELAAKPYVPVSTYRVQFNGAFGFSRAAELLDYFAELGVDALYCSPFLQAQPGSPHGYDVVDPTRLNSELGSQADYDALCEGLSRRGMGQIMDLVPNHMGVAGSANAWWLDVLENGPSSAYAPVFDIDWNPLKAELKDRVLLPILGELYGKELESGAISVEYAGGAFFVRYWEHRLPADPGSFPLLLDEGAARFPELEPLLGALRRLPSFRETDPARSAGRRREKERAKARLRALHEGSPELRSWLERRLAEVNGRPGEPASFRLLHRFLEAQPYRLAFWRAAADEINYRRFFDINALAAIRIEDERVFALHHALALRLVREGRVQGLRIDHPDGLYDPTGYFERLQTACLAELVARRLGAGGGEAVATAARVAAAETLREAGCGAAPFYVVAEKILERKEELPKAWAVSGAVGYGFLNALNGVFVDRSKEVEFDRLYLDYIGHPIDYGRLVYDKKKFFTLINMASETATLGHQLDRISEQDWRSRDLTRNLLTIAIREVLACFPVYRTYTGAGDAPVSERDERYIRSAVGKARGQLPALDPGVFDFLERVLLVKPGGDLELERLYREFTLRFQQISGPIMAKGVEDTSFYVFNRLLSLNEVGGDPTRFGWTREEFHSYLGGRRQNWPAAMLVSSTHDTKRSHDVRMRLDALSELPLEWKTRLAKWGALNEPHKTALGGALEPRRNTEYFIYQTLLGVWPNEPLDEAGRAELLRRVREALLKSSREAKIYTDWGRPNAEYEEALMRFVTALLSSQSFLASFLPFQRKVAFYGMLNSLSASTLQLAAPGVSDCYQGGELWDYSLVDPDNRRPVDFELRGRLLRSLVEEQGPSGPTPEAVAALLRAWPDGRIKMHVLRQGLRLRRRRRALFLDGDYLPLDVEGVAHRHALAFMRRWESSCLLAAAGRFFSGVFPEGSAGQGTPAVWQRTAIVLPEGAAGEGVWRNILTGEAVEPVVEEGRRVLELSKVFATLSTALLLKEA